MNKKEVERFERKDEEKIAEAMDCQLNYFKTLNNNRNATYEYLVKCEMFVEDKIKGVQDNYIYFKKSRIKKANVKCLAKRRIKRIQEASNDKFIKLVF